MILGERLKYEPVRYLGRLYGDRATALSGLGRYQAADADYQRSIASTEQADLAERARRLAVLNGLNTAHALEDTNQALQRENQSQRDQILTQRAVRRLSLGLAAAAVIACALLGYLLVIEQRHRQALAHSSAILRTLTDNLPDTVMLLDRDGNLEFANRPLPGRSAAPNGTQVADVMPTQVRTLWSGFIDEVLNSGATHTLQLGWDDAQGSHRWIENCATPVVAGGTLLGITLRSTDVTARQALEGQLLLQARVLDAMSDGVIVIDGKGCPTFANSRMYELLGMEAGDHGSKRLTALGPAAAELQRAAASSDDQTAAYIEVALRAADGADRLACVAISRLSLAGRSVLICVCHDIFRPASNGTCTGKRHASGVTGDQRTLTRGPRAGSHRNRPARQELLGTHGTVRCDSPRRGTRYLAAS
jgi:PAS domain-containing protein